MPAVADFELDRLQTFVRVVEQRRVESTRGRQRALETGEKGDAMRAGRKKERSMLNAVDVDEHESSRRIGVYKLTNKLRTSKCWLLASLMQMNVNNRGEIDDYRVLPDRCRRRRFSAL